MQIDAVRCKKAAVSCLSPPLKLGEKPSAFPQIIGFVCFGLLLAMPETAQNHKVWASVGITRLAPTDYNTSLKMILNFIYRCFAI